jgi:hypothetical protein
MYAPTNSDQDDALLVQAAGKGDLEAFNQLVLKYSNSKSQIRTDVSWVNFDSSGERQSHIVFRQAFLTRITRIPQRSLKIRAIRSFVVFAFRFWQASRVSDLELLY